MSKIKKSVLLSGCILGVMCAIAVTNEQAVSGPQYKWGLAHHYPPSAAQARLTSFLGELIEKFSDGRIKITVYPAGSRGGTAEVTKAVQQGDLELAYMAPYSTINPKFEVVTGLPWIVTTHRQAQELLDIGGFLGNYMDKCSEEVNLHPITHLGSRAYSLISTKPVRTLADLKGLKVREFGGKGMFKMWERLGALPVSMGSGEVYEALRLKTIDAAVADPEYAQDKKWTEVAKFFIDTNHEPYTTAVVMNKRLYEGLPEDLRKAIDEAGFWHQAAQKYFTRLALSNSIKEMKKIGVEYIKLSDSTRQTFIDAVKPQTIWEKTVVKFEGKEFFEHLLSERKRIIENCEY
jgi:TRAP-type C4-dicarboxylate transport system substrate-binding protein